MPSWLSTLASSWLLLSSVYAGRLDDVARNKGYHPQMVRDMNAQAQGIQERATKRRYYNENTAKYFVESLPDIPQSFMTEMYSGLIPIDENDPSRALFFVFQPKVGAPVDEITFWTNGGPGCSSLEGFFQENGLIQWTWGQYAPTINPYSWVNLTNMLWVEQPVGTGFSIGTPNATNEEDIASDVVRFFKNFETIFGIKDYSIYITGESYAGRYVPYIANAMLDQDDCEYFNVSGALMYDPCIGAFDVQNDIYTVPFITHNNNVLGYNASYLASMEASDESCGFAQYREDYMHFPPNGTQPVLNESAHPDCGLWNSAYNSAYAPNPCFNVYEIGLQCPLLSDPLGYPTDLQYSYEGLPVYFNRTDVKTAMHAPMNVSWSECAAHKVFVGGKSGPEGYGDTSPDPIQGVLPRVIQDTNRVLIANGDLDMDILTNATLLAIQNMTWNGKLGFQARPSMPIDISLPDLEYQNLFDTQGFKGLDRHQGIMGVQHYERGLMFAETYLSGHMEPQFQPRSSYRHMQWMLGHIESL